MTEQSSYYTISGLSGNNIIESLMMEGYTDNDIYAYLLDNLSQIKDKYPYIHKIMLSLIDIYTKQYKVSLNASNLKSIIDRGDEFSCNIVVIRKHKNYEIINACSYHQKKIEIETTKKQILKKNTTTATANTTEPPVLKKIIIKKKVN